MQRLARQNFSLPIYFNKIEQKKNEKRLGENANIVIESI
jgi:hypothetical protein